MKPKFYLTTPIYYVNAPPHMGTAYTTIIADALARTKRMLGFEALLVTGSDEHSQNIADKAQAAGLTPQEFCARLIPEFHKAWKMLDIGPYEFYQTSGPEHREVVQALFRKIHANGDIYKKDYSGWYHTTDNRFVDQAELPEEPEKHPYLKFLTEEAYWFKLSKYQDWLIQYHDANPTAITPDFRRNEMLNRLKEPLRDLCISRSSTTWGIPLPWDEQHVFYVWVDALVTYLTGSHYDVNKSADQQPDNNFWPCDLHIMAKDIPWFHTIIWPAMLHAAGVAPAKQCLVHGYWNFDGHKMSKSLGNVFNPVDAVSLVGADGVRFFMLRDVKLGMDGNFSVRGLAERYNYDLANDFGNLMNRSLTMCGRFCKGKVPEYKGEQAELEAKRKSVAEAAVELMVKLEFKDALETVWELVKALNKLIDDEKPWELNKDKEKRDRLEGFFAILFRSIRTVLLLLAPIMPTAADNFWEQCGLPGQATTGYLGDWDYPFPADAIVKVPTIVFPKLDLNNLAEEFIMRKETLTGEAVERVEEPAAPAAAAPAPEKKPEPKSDEPGEIQYEDFAKVKLITAKVLKAEAVPGSDKLLRLTVDDGKVQDRTIVSGIRAHFSPEDMVGRTISIVDNLKPRKIFGILSQGMILAAGDGEVLRLMVPEGGLQPGVRIG